MSKDMGASSYEDRATAAEPVVSALRGGIPSADELERRIALVWLGLGQCFADFIAEPEWIDTVAQADFAIGMAERAETCWRNAATLIVAQGIETAAAAETAGLSPEGESPVPQGCAQTQSPSGDIK